MTKTPSKSTNGPGTQAKLSTRAEEKQARLKREDALLKARATEGTRDQETTDAVLALGGDATRSSPVREQVLNDWDPGLTTTTGAYRSPIDPTTAAVPDVEDPYGVVGTPTVGSDEHGTPEERYKKPEGGDTAAERLAALPTREEWEKKDQAAAKELTTAGQKETFHQ